MRAGRAIEVDTKHMRKRDGSGSGELTCVLDVWCRPLLVALAIGRGIAEDPGDTLDMLALAACRASSGKVLIQRAQDSIDIVLGAKDLAII